MKTVYISRAFQPVAVFSHAPGDIYSDPVLGDCRRLTAKRFCLAAERTGKESDAFLGLLAAIDGAAEKGIYDGRAVVDWYGLVGLKKEVVPEGELQYGVCSRCGAPHWYAMEELRDLCFDCWHGPGYIPVFYNSHIA